ncbi:MAG: choice-of-anchor J domain-containing protein [Bacteroidetes bacterium]|nr:choice-of-anchor J domain-containing protein [Bacteroidota bacterium]
MTWLRVRYVLIFLLFAEFLLINDPLISSPGPLSPAILKGKVTNGISGNAIIGAKITVNGNYTYSVINGQFSMMVDPPGTYTVSCTKPGFDLYTSAPITFQGGVYTMLNIQLLETTNPCPSISATLNTGEQTVHLSWEKPVGDYELLYDDGIQDSFTVWAQQGNMNALKISPLAYPVNILGGSVNIGRSSDYPAGSNPFVPFQIMVMDAGGSGGTPGQILSGPFDVTPTVFGWIDFTLSAPVTLTSGDFFIVMVQGGNAPNAAGLAVDLTTAKYRSYSRFVSGSGAWLQANGNFMIRAVLNGTDGPPASKEATGSADNYKLWRLQQGEESNPQAWTFINDFPSTNAIDTAWKNLPCGPYLWAVQAQYPGSRLSAPAISNLIGKCWTASVTINLSMSCSASSPFSTFVQLKNLVYTDTVYSAYADSSGIVVFQRVWKGSYSVTAVKFGYQAYNGSLSVMGDIADNITLLQRKSPPTNLRVDSLSLDTRWDVPYYNQTLLQEDWSGGSIPAAGWTIEGGGNWIISTSNGHPAPSALFNWTPRVYNYNQSIISPVITGLNSPILTLKYDLSLENFSSAILDQLFVEISDGSGWSTLRTWSNSGGNISWTSDQIDISSFANKNFRIRFRSAGADSYQVNGWYIDNILVYASESAHLLSPCIYGYNFYLNNSLLATVTSNSYTIPGTEVIYDSTYQACVTAIYTSGYSASDCVPFTSGFLWPPSNLSGTAMGNKAILQWNKPVYYIGSTAVTPAGILGYNIYRDDSLLVFSPGADVITFSDTALDPGSYNYKVAAVYDLGAYGHPGHQGISGAALPVNVQIHYGIQLPFSELWDQGSFAYNSWTFPSGQGNWSISQTMGNPAPSAIFSGLPQQSAYNAILQSPVLDASMYSCARIWLDFDLKLDDNTSGGTEHLILDVFYNRSWHQKSVINNTGNTGWVHFHTDISAVKEKGFKFRFRATGLSSSNILYWYVDNINIYPVCLPAENLSGDARAMDTWLQWSPPQCNGGGTPLNEGFEEAAFPPPGWDRIVTNASANWSHNGISSPTGVHSGSYSAGLSWDYYHQDEWIIARNIYVDGNLKFWSMAYQGSAHGDHYFVKVSTDQGQSWVTLLDMSALPPYPGQGGYNHWQEPYVVDMSPYLGDVVDLAWHAVDGNGQGLWYYWAIDDCSIGSKKIPVTAQPWYDIYRKDYNGQGFVKINASQVFDTTYIDSNLPAGQYHYYIQIVNPVCSAALTSDTIMVDVMTSVPAIGRDVKVMVYPNPAHDQISIKSAEPLHRLILTDLMGNTETDTRFNGEKEACISIRGLPPGLYLFRIFSGTNCYTGKITINR